MTASKGDGAIGAGLCLAYSGWALDDPAAVLAALSAAGVGPAHPIVICDHITLSYPDTAPAPAHVTTARLIAVAADDQVQAVVAQVAGDIVRPCGRIYHVTYSLTPGAVAVQSNDLLLRPGATWAPIPPLEVPVTAFLRPVP